MTKKKDDKKSSAKKEPKPKKVKLTDAEKVAAKAAKDAEKREKADEKKGVGGSQAIAFNTMKVDITRIIVDQLRVHAGFGKVKEQAQREILAAIENVVDETLDKAVKIIASDQRIVVIGTLEGVNVKDKATLSIKVPKHDKAFLSIFPAVGQEVIVVVASAKSMQGDGDKAQIDKDQSELSLAADSGKKGAKTTAEMIQDAWDKDDAEHANKKDALKASDASNGEIVDNDPLGVNGEDADAAEVAEAGELAED